MLFIPCTNRCIYQQEGTCTLTRAGSGGTQSVAATASGCVHFVDVAPRAISSAPPSLHL